MSRHVRFGIFLAPFHALDENPVLAIERDLELIEWLERHDYDEAWVGEHHSGGFEVIACPEVFIAAAAERTRRIRLGTGVVSLPYHHPLMVADRILQLDYMTRGRVMLGVGPGSLTADADKMGIPISVQRRRMDEAISVLVPLLRGEIVSRKTDWFELRDAQLQMECYTKPMVEMAVASARSPVGARAAGKYGLGMLSVGSTTDSGLAAHASNWQTCEAISAENGHRADRSRWRVVSLMHIAETREQAERDIEFGLEPWVRYFREISTFPIVPEGVEDYLGYMRENGTACIGTPDDAITAIERLWEGSQGGFGCYMLFAHNWADWAQTKRSYELIARYVMPHFQSRLTARSDSYDFSAANNERLAGEARTAVRSEIERHQDERARRGEAEEWRTTRPMTGGA